MHFYNHTRNFSFIKTNQEVTRDAILFWGMHSMVVFTLYCPVSFELTLNAIQDRNTVYSMLFIFILYPSRIP